MEINFCETRREGTNQHGAHFTVSQLYQQDAHMLFCVHGKQVR